jgi:hypothetical protein
MYFMISIQIIDPSKQDGIVEGIKEILDAYDWVRPIASLFVVACTNESEKDEVKKEMNEFAKKHQDNLRFIISPIILGGALNGFANEKVWPALKLITQATPTFS